MMKLDALREEVFRANLALARSGLVPLTWGNASGMDRKQGIVIIKPSGVAYDRLKAEDMVLVDQKSGRSLGGKLNPSSDTPTHLELYRAFPDVAGVVHTHSRTATAWAQAGREIPCLGTTHADSFHGPVPLTRPMGDAEIQKDYERNTGLVIVERFKDMDPLHFPGVLVHGHGPFTWGKTPMAAVENAIVLEEVAVMALATVTLAPQAGPISRALLDKHFLRKHGPGAYYGQGK